MGARIVGKNEDYPKQDRKIAMNSDMYDTKGYNLLLREIQMLKKVIKKYVA